MDEMVFEVFFNDLTKEAQEAILKFYGLENPSEANWEYYPLFTLERHPEDE